MAQGKTNVGNATYGAGTKRAVDGSDTTYWGYSTLPWWISINLNEIKKDSRDFIFYKAMLLIVQKIMLYLVLLMEQIFQISTQNIANKLFLIMQVIINI